MFVRKCGAKARTNNHRPCRQPAMLNGRCRLHGGKSTGAKTEAGKLRRKLVNITHGFYTAESIAERKIMREMIREAKQNLR